MFTFMNFPACVRRKLLHRKIGDSNVLANGLVPLSPNKQAAKFPPSMIRGWISKEGGAVRRSFNNRYFVLVSTATSTTLTYYLKKAPNDKNGKEVGPPYGIKKRGELDLRGGVFTQGTTHSTVTGGNGKKKYILDLKSCSEGDEWVQALQKHIDYANHQQSISNKIKAGIREDSMFSFADIGV